MLFRSTAGTHTIVAAGGSAANYNIATVNGTLTVNKANLTVTANNQTKTYGATDPTLTANYTGLQYTDTSAVVSNLSLTAPTNASATAGTHTIVAAGGSAANYNVATVNGTLTVNKANLNVTANDQTKTYGAADPTLTANYTGLQ